MDKDIHTHTHTHTHTHVYVCIYEYYSAIKRSELLPFSVIWMDLESNILGETSQTERQILYVITVEI